MKKLRLLITNKETIMSYICIIMDKLTDLTVWIIKGVYDGLCKKKTNIQN